MLLNSDLGNMVDLVVDLNSNLVDNRGSGNSNWSSMSNSDGGSMGNSNRGSMGNSNRGSVGNSNWSSGSNSNRSSSSNCRSRCIDTIHKTMAITKETMTKDTTSNDLSISISSRSSKATGHKGRQNSKRLHIDCVECIPTIPM